MDSKDKIDSEDIKKEFQLERMILFSDAVFAIVITLMAIEIKIPEMNSGTTEEMFLVYMRHLLPNLFSYTVSFIFIGILWTRHLKIFSVLKDYDTGLIFRNLLLLFFVGLFPFSSSLISRPHLFFTPYYIYFSVIFFCVTAQYLINHYITITKPQLRITKPNEEDLMRDKFSKYLMIGFGIMIFLIVITTHFISDQSLKIFGMYWVFLFLPLLRILKKRMFKKFKH